ncbi:hypothetical protein ACFLZ8_05635 [Planctomycetota bacterium]
MKKYLFTAIVVSMILTICIVPQAQAARGQGGRQRGGTLNVESVNAAVAAIEEQIAAIKEAMEGAEPAGARGDQQGGGARGGQRGGGQVEIAGLGGAQQGGGARGGARGGDMQAMQQRTQVVQAAALAIAEQILLLDSTPAQTEITELQAAAAQATEEEATDTAALIQAMITARVESAQAVGVNIAGRGGMGGRGGGGGFGGGRGGGFTPPEGGFQYEDD